MNKPTLPSAWPGLLREQDHSASLVSKPDHGATPDHLLHFTPTPYGALWRLECLPHGEHFTVHSLEEWDCSADELEANGIEVDRTTCWVHDWLDNADAVECWMVGPEWEDAPEDGPWTVDCSFGGALDVRYVPVGPPKATS